MTATVTRRRVSKPASTKKPGASKQRESDKRPKLRVVDKVAIKRRARRRALLIASATVVAAGLFCVALMYAQLAKGQHHLDSLRSEIDSSETELARLERDIVQASSPHAVVARATELGMVRAENPVYLTAEPEAVVVVSTDAAAEVALQDVDS